MKKIICSFLVVILFLFNPLNIRAQNEIKKDDSISIKKIESRSSNVKYVRKDNFTVYKINKDTKLVTTEDDYYLLFAFLGFIALLGYYIFDNYNKKQEKDTHNFYLVVSVIGSVLIAGSILASLIYNLYYAPIFGILSIITCAISWHKDSWGMFFVNLLFIFLYLESLYMLV